MLDALPGAMPTQDAHCNATTLLCRREENRTLRTRLWLPSRKKLTLSNARERRQKMASPEKIKLAAQKASALTVKCPYCHAEPGQPCRNKDTSQPLQYSPGHTPRLLDSIKNQEMDVPF